MSAGATQAETIERRQRTHDADADERAGRCWLLASLSRVWMKLGISMVNSAEHRGREHHEQQRE